MERIVLSILIGFFCLNVSGQEAAIVNSFIQTTDHISIGDRRNDFNGNPCALVKVQVVDFIERVEGNTIGRIVEKGVEKWVYMCSGSRNMKIHLKNHLPVKVIFKDYKIDGLEGNRVYELTINLPSTQLPDQTVGSTNTHIKPYIGNKEQQEEIVFDNSKMSQSVDNSAILRERSLIIAQAKADSIAREEIIQREKERQRKAELREKRKVFWGVRAGYNMATTSFSSEYESPKSISAFHAGMNIDVKLTKQIHFETGLLYSAKGYKYDGSYIEEKANPQYLDIPLLASVHIPINDKTFFLLNGGLYAAFCIGGDVSDEYNHYYKEKFTSAYNSFDYGVQAGIGILIHDIYIGIGYQIGLDSKYPNKNLFASIGYNF